MLKSLKLLKKYREIFLDVTMEEPEDFDEIGISFINQFDEAIRELEALQSRSCDECKHRIFHTFDSFKNVTIDKCGTREQLHFNGSCDGLCCNRYEPKETRV